MTKADEFMSSAARGLVRVAPLILFGLIWHIICTAGLVNKDFLPVAGCGCCGACRLVQGRRNHQKSHNYFVQGGCGSRSWRCLRNLDWRDDGPLAPLP